MLMGAWMGAEVARAAWKSAVGDRPHWCVSVVGSADAAVDGAVGPFAKPSERSVRQTSKEIYRQRSVVTSLAPKPIAPATHTVGRWAIGVDGSRFGLSISK